tara:strand:- start:2960 stop:3457 length:498 start_codon:yes stop_codon:yes gene_type:complete
MSKLILKAAEKHKDWIKIVKSFGCPPEIAEDIVQEMYIYLINYEKKGIDIWYNDDEVNYYYIFKQLRGIYIAYVRSEKKVTKVGVEYIQNNVQDISPQEYESQYRNNLDAYNEAIEEVYWYDRKVFELIAQGKSVAELSRDTSIGYYSLYNTFNKIKATLKNKLL